MKQNLIVSNCTELWIKDSNSFRFLSGYSLEYAKNNNILENAQDKVFCRDSSKSKESIDFIEARLTRYLPILVDRLVVLHGHDSDFWCKVVSLYLRDLISASHYFFSMLEKTFDPDVHILKIARLPNSVPLFGVTDPTDPAYWNITDEGREYYAGEYFRTFYPGLFPEVSLSKKDLPSNPPCPNQITKKTIDFIRLRRIIIKKLALGRLKRITKRILGRIFLYRMKIFITRVSCDKNFSKKLFIRSLGRIYYSFDAPSLTNIFDPEEKPNPDIRDFLSKPFSSNPDRFEQYLCQCLKTSLPWNLSEGFKRSFEVYKNYWNKFPNLKYIVAEWMYQQDSLFLCVSATLDKIIIRIPHFYPLEIFESSKFDTLHGMVKYISRGKKHITETSAIGTGTFFQYEILRKNSRASAIDTLYIGTDFYPYFFAAEQSADGTGYEVFLKYKEFVDDLFCQLTPDSVSKIAIKRRRQHFLQPIQLEYPAGIRFLNSISSAKLFMADANLVIVEGHSTSLFESIASNIPTIGFWPSGIYRIHPKFDFYFSVLENAGIIYHDTTSLARKILEVQANPSVWWSGREVQFARKVFLENNLHLQDKMQQTLLGLL